MTTKIFIRISIVALIPLFFSTIFMSMIALEWYFSNTNDFANMFLTGKFNKPFTAILFTINIFAVSIIMWSMMCLSRYAPLIDKFDDATIEMHKARETFNAATRKLVDQMKLK